MQAQQDVLFVFFQTSNKANGGLNSLMEIILNLKQVRPLVVTQRDTDLTKKLVQNGVEVIILPIKSSKKWTKAFNILSFSVSILKLIKKRSIKVIHINDMNSLMHSAFAIKKSKAKVVFNIRDVFEPNRSYGKKWRLVNLCDEVIVLSHNMKVELLRRLPLNKRKSWAERFHVSFSIVNFKRFTRPTAEERKQCQTALGFDPNETNLLYVATFGIKKNQLQFIREALPLLRTLNVKLHFVGDFNPDVNSYAKSCKLAINGEVQDKVVFHGFQSDVETFYKAADLTLVPTLREGMARCMIESLSCGLPVVSFDVSSAEEILTSYSSCGIVVPQGEYQQMVEGIKTLLNDKTKRDAFAQNGFELSRRIFDKTAVVQAYETVYMK